MAVLIGTSTQKKVFNKTQITIGSTPNCDFVVNIGKGPILLQYSPNKGKYIIANKYNNENILIQGIPLSGSMYIENSLRLTVANTNEVILIKMVELQQEKAAPVKTSNIQDIDLEENFELQHNSSVQTINTAFDDNDPIESKKAELEKLRAPIIKEVGFAINDIKNRLTLNNRASVFVHIALILSSIVTGFGISNFITGLKIQESANFINLPTNIKILALFAVIVYGLSLVLKQGAFLHFQNKKFPSTDGGSSEKLMLGISTLVFIAFYVINLIYYLNVNPVFAIFMSLFFVGITAVLAYAAGHFKCQGHLLSYELDKYEYREDFEAVMHNYRNWINRFINSLSNNKIESLKDKIFNLQIWSGLEILAGFITAPFLAYGVSNTLAMCFPEAAGWLRIGGLRFSPIFLALATFLIIFAFFSFVSAFLTTRKIQASQVIKLDGFSDYFSHGVEIYGIQAVRKLDSERIRSLIIGCSIIFIEFTMNTSYFCTEMGGDLSGILMSVIAALVPTALLMAETYMLSHTKFEMEALSELLAKRD